MSLTRKNVLSMLRSALNWTQQETADYANLSLRTVIKAEKETCTDKTWHALLAVYEGKGLTLHYLTHGRIAIVASSSNQLTDDARALVALQLPGIDQKAIDRARLRSNKL